MWPNVATYGSPNFPKVAAIVFRISQQVDKTLGYLLGNFCWQELSKIDQSGRIDWGRQSWKGSFSHFDPCFEAVWPGWAIFEVLATNFATKEPHKFDNFLALLINYKLLWLFYGQLRETLDNFLFQHLVTLLRGFSEWAFPSTKWYLLSYSVNVLNG